MRNIVKESASKQLKDKNRHTEPATLTFDDVPLVRKAKKGDMQAFGTLVSKYQDRVYNIIFRMCPRPAEAEELAQETFLKALEGIGQFRGKSAFYTWIFRIATNLTISHRRRSGKIRFQPLAASDRYDDTQVRGLTAKIAGRQNVSPEKAAMDNENQRLITRALEELEEEFRIVVILRDIENMNYQQIADILTIPAGTVKSRLHRGRCLLKDKLAEVVK